MCHYQKMILYLSFRKPYWYIQNVEEQQIDRQTLIDYGKKKKIILQMIFQMCNNSSWAICCFTLTRFQKQKQICLPPHAARSLCYSVTIKYSSMENLFDFSRLASYRRVKVCLNM